MHFQRHQRYSFRAFRTKRQPNGSTKRSWAIILSLKAAAMRRRDFIKLIGVGWTTFWPLAARAQQSLPALIGFFNAGAATILKREIDAFRGGLRNLGYIEGRDVRFEYRFADGDLDKLPAL